MSAPSETANLKREIANLYPEAVTDCLIHAYTADGIHRAAALPDPNPHIGAAEKVYGDIVADGQVRAPERLLVQQLREAGVPLPRVHRYLIGWKPGFVRKVLPDVMGVPHGSDGVIWNYNIMNGPEREEREIMTEWIQDLVKFVNGKEMHYGTSAWTEQKYLGPDGKISVQQDRKWEYLLRVADLMAAVDSSRS
ncbi:hypothetical protein QFC19_006747 [Naganishia cerealis]|uniref:Uncharacterized protein n=1 Tax=Naganishia cerealis TaxID=610337 RepID=A0ACC2VDX5_9TREE|nr:hypothetical protein QFC19_006747 [Naganishia cerealis]